MNNLYLGLLHAMFMLLLLSLVTGCKDQSEPMARAKKTKQVSNIVYAQGFSVELLQNGVKILHVNTPWPGAEKEFVYALIPRNKLDEISLNSADYDAVIPVPVKRIVATSTTHIPALEALGVLDQLVGFPETGFISSAAARQRVETGAIQELGSNQHLNTEMTIALEPDLVVTFGIDGPMGNLKILEKSNIPVVYNGDWMEQSPLGKAEWIKFFAAFFDKEKKADTIFKAIETAYLNAKKMAKKSDYAPTVLSGAMYKDIWYLPGGKSWAAQFMSDANANYLWKDNMETGSLSLSWESVLNKAADAEIWISPAQFTSYSDMQESSLHYQQFTAFNKKQVFTFALTKGKSGGVLYYELAPQRPDLVLKDLIHIFHPKILSQHKLFFFKPLE